MAATLSTYIARGRPNRACPPPILYQFARYLHGLLPAGGLRHPLPDCGRVIAVGDWLPVEIMAAGSPYPTTGRVTQIKDTAQWGWMVTLEGLTPNHWIISFKVSKIPLRGAIETEGVRKFWARHRKSQNAYRLGVTRRTG